MKGKGIGMNPPAASLNEQQAANRANKGTTPVRSAEAPHDHGRAPAFLPHWWQERWRLILVALAGLFFILGWAGQTFFGLSPQLARLCFVLAYLFGGYDI